MVHNPYQAPHEPPQNVASNNPLPKWTLLFVPWLLLIATGCALVALMATYEIVSLRPNDYGQHTNTFRMSYAKTAMASLALLATSVLGARLLHRGHRSGVVIAAIVTGLVLTWVARSMMLI